MAQRKLIRQHRDMLLDNALKDTFPSSDPVAMTYATGVRPRALPYNFDELSVDALCDALDSYASLPDRLSLDHLDTYLPSGEKVDWASLSGRKLVIETASMTSPHYYRNRAAMKRLQSRFRDALFIVLYVRENSPGRHLPPHQSLDEKMERARALVSDGIESRKVMVDDLVGSLHRRMGGLPNSVWILDGKGQLIHRDPWCRPNRVAETLSGMDVELASALEELEPPKSPMYRHVLRSVGRAGFKALKQHLAAMWQLHQGIKKAATK